MFLHIGGHFSLRVNLTTLPSRSFIAVLQAGSPARGVSGPRPGPALADCCETAGHRPCLGQLFAEGLATGEGGGVMFGGHVGIGAKSQLGGKFEQNMVENEHPNV
jgi:hypothetical protein